MSDKPLKFDPNSNEHLVWVLKLAYKYAVGDIAATSEETAEALCIALCNEIGDEGFCEFFDSEVITQ